jgi:hypothetical protein
VSGQKEDARNTVKVDVVMEDGFIVLTPLNSEGKEILQQILDAGSARSEWHFQGTHYKTPGVKDRIIAVDYACGGEQYKRRKGNSIRFDYKGAIKVHFDLADVADEDALHAMRNFGYFTGSLVVQTGATADKVRLGASNLCKECGGQLVKFIELDWKVCDSCAEKCKHDYEEGVGHAGGRLAYLPFCKKCGRGDPNWQPSDDPAEDMLRTVTEGGIDMLILKHPDETATVITKQQ